jgi:hypothetical protein
VVNAVRGVPDYREAQNYVKPISNCLGSVGLSGDVPDSGATRGWKHNRTRSDTTALQLKERTVNLKVSAIYLLLALSLFAMPNGIFAIAQQGDVTIYDRDVKVADFRPVPFYPTAPRSAQMEGVVVVRVKLDDDGKVVDAIGLSGERLLIHDCLINAKQWRFKPNSGRVAFLVYNFRLAGRCRDNTEMGQSIFYPPNFTEITACHLLPTE